MVWSVTKWKCNVHCVYLRMCCGLLQIKLFLYPRILSRPSFDHSFFPSFNFVEMACTQFFVCHTIEKYTRCDHFSFSIPLVHPSPPQQVPHEAAEQLRIGSLHISYEEVSAFNIWCRIGCKLFATWQCCIVCCCFCHFSLSLPFCRVAHCIHRCNYAPYCTRIRHCQHHRHHQNMNCDCYFAVSPPTHRHHQQKTRMTKRELFKLLRRPFLCACVWNNTNV